MMLDQDISDIDGSGFTGIIRAYYLAFQVVSYIIYSIDDFIKEIQ